jgi:hypothetical protein
MQINVSSGKFTDDIIIPCGMSIYGEGAALTELSGKIQTIATNGINTLLFAGLKFTYTGDGHRLEV